MSPMLRGRSKLSDVSALQVGEKGEFLQEDRMVFHVIKALL